MKQIRTAKHIRSWEVSDELWIRVEPLIPIPTRDLSKTYKRKPGGGRKPLDNRQIFAAIVYVLRTGIQWKALPKEFGSSSSIHKYFRQWSEAGFFRAIWLTGVAEYDAMEGIAWDWTSIDSSSVKAPLAQESVGPNPTDRGKKWEQTPPSRGRPWRPVVNRRNRRQSS